MEFFTGVLVGEGGDDNVPLQALDVLCYATREETVDNLQDSIVFHRDEGHFVLHSAEVFQNDLNGNCEHMVTLSTDEPVDGTEETAVA